ncbi:uncharacterized protein Z520_09682 [Fonsecaea multimorphosa CBS 102226]|uniref:Uncharacterized protein n=1 Tax=Fonsecaea multimorphosa CBS 102226 TaxID=1442371 RepID=A0A0D2IBW0_9EURO|nr:uncharacterized protein Z520_09682 [Fonsecaea multimorphosa CBS 102226]KIX94636.1 hypothetical protein Z520_09682 [Fonsecaea multimorphosa CBS 102226]OAL20342.1 hypothetical protein AYO22_09054 [Fonsecaea multimorphosa]
MFERDASIVLLGPRGSGKTTLAIIVQAALGLQHIDSDDVFQKETGFSALQFRKQFGSQQYRRHCLSFLEKLLRSYSKNCVIVWPRDLVEEAAFAFLKQYCTQHPVILVQRDSAAIESYLQLSPPSKIERILEILIPRYRACSSYEYFNLEETMFLGQATMPENDLPHATPRILKPLLLKRVEKSFLRFLAHVMLPSSLHPEPSGQLLLPQSRAKYTYLLTLPVAQINSADFDMRWLNCGADAVQLEIDLDPLAGRPASLSKEMISKAYAAVTRTFDGPVVYHLKAASHLRDSRYLDLLDHGFRLAAELVTIHLDYTDEELRRMMELRRSSRLIGDYHDSSPSENGWMSQARLDPLSRARNLGFDAVRLTQPALCASDNRDALGFLSSHRGQIAGLSVIAYNTGHLGRTSRCYNEILTPVTTEDLQNHLLRLAMGRSLQSEITIQQSQGSLYASFIYDPMKYYIIGLDVSYSVSPVVHNAAHQFFGMPHRLHIRSMSTLDGLSQITNDENFGGLTVAQGFKETLLTHLSAASMHAKAIGAINTLLPIRAAFDYTQPPPRSFWTNRNRIGPVLAFYGDNLDWVGMKRCLEQNLSPANVITPQSTALVVGAGGMARAAIYALLNLGVQHIVLYNRTCAHARTLAEYFSTVELDTSTSRPQYNGRMASPSRRDIRVLESRDAPWFDDLAPPTAVLSCIPVPKPWELSQDQFILPVQWMKSPTGGVVIDMNYQTLLTPLLRQVLSQSDRGWIAVDGLENLVEQASAQFEIFTCRKVPKFLMHIVALQHYLSRSKEDTELCQYLETRLRQLQSTS